MPPKSVVQQHCISTMKAALIVPMYSRTTLLVGGRFAPPATSTSHLPPFAAASCAFRCSPRWVAVPRASAIWRCRIKSYSGDAWNWADVPGDDVLPEALVLEIIGNRKPLLFCEGERGGLDHTSYQRCFPNHHVLPRGRSDKVIEATRAPGARTGSARSRLPPPAHLASERR